MKTCPWCGNAPTKCDEGTWGEPTVMCMAEKDCPLHAVGFSETEWQRPRAPSLAIAQAVDDAWLDLYAGEAWPVRITLNGKILWEQSGPSQTRKSLKKYAESEGIALPEYDF